MAFALAFSVSLLSFAFVAMFLGRTSSPTARLAARDLLLLSAGTSPARSLFCESPPKSALPSEMELKDRRDPLSCDEFSNRSPINTPVFPRSGVTAVATSGFGSASGGGSQPGPRRNSTASASFGIGSATTRGLIAAGSLLPKCCCDFPPNFGPDATCNSLLFSASAEATFRSFGARVASETKGSRRLWWLVALVPVLEWSRPADEDALATPIFASGLFAASLSAIFAVLLSASA
mmetsp:Transcript_14286/g.35494  ORF Transcript_14286/g.35494 Transcript_14286/m.35494 type:complete len:235 (+) Transcript_14286:341-1045(+)